MGLGVGIGKESRYIFWTSYLSVGQSNIALVTRNNTRRCLSNINLGDVSIRLSIIVLYRKVWRLRDIQLVTCTLLLSKKSKHFAS